MQEQRQDGHFLAAKLIFFFHLTCQAQTQWHKGVRQPGAGLEGDLAGSRLIDVHLHDVEPDHQLRCASYAVNILPPACKS
jgi:hypothetical protein